VHTTHTAVKHMAAQEPVPAHAPVPTHEHVPTHALWLACAYGLTEQARQHLADGANIEETNLMNMFFEPGLCTPLQIAVMENRVDVVKLLLEHGANVSVLTRKHTTLHLAATHGNDAVREVVSMLLLEHGADVSVKDEYGMSLLDICAYFGLERLAVLLIQHGADVSNKGEDGMTALHWASMQGKVDLISVLLKSFPDVSIKDDDGMTVLHWAAKRGHADVVRLLLQYQANVLAETNSGETAESLATCIENYPIVEMLQEYTVTRAKCVAFAMGHHERLGVGSRVENMDPDLLRMVLAYVE